MVQRVSEDEWRQLKAFSEVYGKHSMQFKLMALLRTMKEYDPQAEKLAFADADLYSLRRKARRWIIRTGRRLAFAAKEVEEQLGDVQMLMAWGHYVDAWEFAAEAKELASAQEEFVVMAGLLQQEKLIARELFEGEELTLELQRIVSEEKANNHFQQLTNAMAESTAHYLEPVKNKLAATGVLDHEAVAAYFDSAVFKSDMHAMPISIQIEKLTLDEFFYNMTGRFDLAASIACQSVALLKQHPAIQDRSPDTLPKLFRKLSTFYAELKDIEKLRDVISQFEAESPTSETRRKHYLPRYIFALFQASIDCDLPDFAVKGMEVWEQESNYLLSLKVDSTQLITLLCVSWYHVGQGDFDRAKSFFQMIKRPPMEMPRLLYQSMMVLLHLVLLFEDGDEVGLASIGLQYRRKLKKKGIVANAMTMKTIASLRNPENLYNAETRKKALTRLADDLRRCQSRPDEERFFWFDPLLKWIERKIGGQ